MMDLSMGWLGWTFRSLLAPSKLNGMVPMRPRLDHVSMIPNVTNLISDVRATLGLSPSSID